MHRFLAGALFLLSASTLLYPQITPVANVNSRYIVESVQVGGNDEFSLSQGIQAEIQNLIGTNLDPNLLDSLSERIKKELHAREVVYRILRGDLPEQVKVSFEVQRRSVEFDVNLPKFLYHSRQGWTGVVEGVTRFGPNVVTFRVLSDADELVERNAGIVARYDHTRLGSDRVALSFEFGSYHQQWNGATTLAGPEDIYRTRHSFEPLIAFQLARPLVLTVGASFQNMQIQFPAARTESANALVNTLRYHRVLEGTGASKQVLDAGYSLRAATKVLSTDFVYARHRFDAGYMIAGAHHALLVSFIGGLISGNAPLFDRFILGNASTLRGWNKWDVDPLGGDRVAHGTVEYRYRFFQVFYDTGAVWDRSQDRVARNSIGAGLRKDGFSLAVAFPLREGRADPVVIAGMNF